MIAVRSKGLPTPKNLAQMAKHYKDLASDIEKKLKSGGTLAWKGNKNINIDFKHRIIISTDICSTTLIRGL